MRPRLPESFPLIGDRAERYETQDPKKQNLPHTPEIAPPKPVSSPSPLTSAPVHGYGNLVTQSNDLDTVFAALADPTRRAILTMLLEDDMAVTDVADPFDISLAAISKHLAILTRAGLISQEKRGRVKWCKLEPDALRAASVWMQGFGQFDPVDLDDFEKFLEAALRD